MQRGMQRAKEHDEANGDAEELQDGESMGGEAEGTHDGEEQQAASGLGMGKGSEGATRRSACERPRVMHD